MLNCLAYKLKVICKQSYDEIVNPMRRTKGAKASRPEGAWTSGSSGIPFSMTAKE